MVTLANCFVTELDSRRLSGFQRFRNVSHFFRLGVWDSMAWAMRKRRRGRSPLGYANTIDVLGCFAVLKAKPSAAPHVWSPEAGSVQLDVR